MTFHIICNHIYSCPLETQEPIELPFAPSIHYSLNSIYNNSQVNLNRLTQYFLEYLDKKAFLLNFLTRPSVSQPSLDIYEPIWLNFAPCLLCNIRIIQKEFRNI